MAGHQLLESRNHTGQHEKAALAGKQQKQFAREIGCAGLFQNRFHSRRLLFARDDGGKHQPQQFRTLAQQPLQCCEIG